MTVAIVGAGRMAGALSRSLARAGIDAPMIDARTVPAGLPPARLVLLAVPFTAALDLVRGPLAGRGGGRILIDVSNPARDEESRIPAGSSGGEVLAVAAPGWRVVKALNTVPARIFDTHRLLGLPVTVPVAGDDDEARDQVAVLVRRLGFAAVDTGGIAASREIEALALLLMRISGRQGLHGEIGIHIGRTTRVQVGRAS